jgi:hypothetical protein
MGLIEIMPDDKEHEKKTTNEKPVSLYPLTTDEALKALLQVKPPDNAKKKRRRKGAK